MELADTIIASLISAIGFLLVALAAWYMKWRKAEEVRKDERMQNFMDTVSERFATIDSLREMTTEELGMLTRVSQQQHEMLVRLEGRVVGVRRDLTEVKNRVDENSNKIAQTREDVAKNRTSNGTTE